MCVFSNSRSSAFQTYSFYALHHKGGCYKEDPLGRPSNSQTTKFLLLLVSQKIWNTSCLTVFLKHSQVGCFKTSNSNSDHLISISLNSYPYLWMGGMAARVTPLERPKGAKDKVKRSEGHPAKSQAPRLLIIVYLWRASNI